MVGASLRVGLLESVLACLADLVALSGVFVVGGDIADAFVEPYFVVVVADAFEFSREVRRNPQPGLCGVGCGPSPGVALDPTPRPGHS